jgi:hypothetical protein
MNVYRESSKMPAHVRGIVDANDSYFNSLLAALERTIGTHATKLGIPDYEHRPVFPHRFFLAKTRDEESIGGPESEMHTKWSMYWVGMLHLWKPEFTQEDQWSWVSNNFYRGEGTNAVVLNCDVTFNSRGILQPSPYSSWSVCESKPSKNTRVEYSSGQTLPALTEENFEEMATRVIGVLRENLIRDCVRSGFRSLPELG